MFNTIGIIAAMEEEAALILKDMTDVVKTNKANMTFCLGKFNDKKLVVVVCGIGKVNAAVCTQILIDKYDVDVVINSGVAGSLDNDIDIADIVVSKDTLNHDMDVSLLGDEVGVIPRMKKSIFEADRRLIDLAMECGKEIKDVKLHEGRVLSGDQFIADKDKKKWLVDTFNGRCCEMEGCAIGQTAYLNDIPFVILRAISDKGDGSATMDYFEFKDIAIEKLHNLVKKMLEKM